MNQSNPFQQLLDYCFTQAYLFEKSNIGFLTSLVSHATNTELKSILQNHVKETKDQLARLEKIIHEKAILLKGDAACPSQVIVEELEKQLKNKKPSQLGDAMIMVAVQQVEHIEIATYSALKDFAQELKDDNLRDLISKTLKEEYGTGSIVSKFANQGFFHKLLTAST